MTKVRAYQTGDVDQIPRRVEQLQRNWSDSLIILSDHAVTLTDDDDNVLMCMGTVMLWPGVADTWSLVHPETGVSALTLVRDTRKLLEDFCQVYGVHRCNAQAFDDDQHRWMQLLGFVDETVMHKYGPQQQDVIGMVKWYRAKRVGVHPKSEWEGFARPAPELRGRGETNEIPA
jgi:hypothetical protein